jgi:hypothetical protein
MLPVSLDCLYLIAPCLVFSLMHVVCFFGLSIFNCPLSCVRQHALAKTQGKGQLNIDNPKKQTTCISENTRQRVIKYRQSKETDPCLVFSLMHVVCFFGLSIFNCPLSCVFANACCLFLWIVYI